MLEVEIVAKVPAPILLLLNATLPRRPSIYQKQSIGAGTLFSQREAAVGHLYASVGVEVAQPFEIAKVLDARGKDGPKSRGAPTFSSQRHAAEQSNLVGAPPLSCRNVRLPDKKQKWGRPYFCF